MTITVCNGKGGAGKTTLAVLLCLALQKAGRQVALIDRDPQATARKWIEETGGIPLANAVGEHPDSIIDTPPRLDSSVLHASLAESECAILVTSPSPADLWTSRNTVALIKQHLPAGKPARILFNQVRRRTLLAQDLDGLASRIGLAPLAARIGSRQSFQHAALLGWSALDTESRNEVTAAAGEILSLTAS